MTVTAHPNAGTVSRMIEIATAEIGVIEGPKDNQTKYGAYTGANYEPWCGSSLMWCAFKAGVQTPPRVVGTVYGAEQFKKLGKWFTTPKAGDFAFMDFIDDNKVAIQHVGLVVKVSETSIVTIEGNTSSGGSQHNGGEVCIQSRKLGPHSFVVGFGRPTYKEAIHE